MITLLFIITCYGACNNMIWGSSFEGFRTLLAKMGTGGYSLYKLFTCFMCLGTWMGFAISFIMYYFGYLNLTPWGAQGIENIYLVIFLNGLLSGGAVWLINTVQEAFELGFYKKED